MRAYLVTVLTSLILAVPIVGIAQDFGVTESAETVDRGNIKFKGSPVLIFGKDNEEDSWGVTLALGYGFTDRFDAEGQVAIYDGMMMFGGNGEFWLAKGRKVDVSFSPGLHFRRGDNTFDQTAIDLTFIASGHSSPRLELYGALDMAFERFGDNVPSDFNYTTAHLVPGLEYRLAEDLDFDAEFGIALNDDSRHYFSAGLTFYLR